MPSLVTVEAWRHTPPAGSIQTPFAFNGNVGNFLTVPIAWLPIIESNSLLLFFSKNWTNNNSPFLWEKIKNIKRNSCSIKTRKCNQIVRLFFIVHNRLIMTLKNLGIIYFLFIHLMWLRSNRKYQFCLNAKHKCFNVFVSH